MDTQGILLPYFLPLVTEHHQHDGPHHHVSIGVGEPTYDIRAKARCNGSGEVVIINNGDLVQDTYDFRGKASVVAEVDDSVVKIIQICLVDRLELMKTIQ